MKGISSVIIRMTSVLKIFRRYERIGVRGSWEQV